MDFSKGTWEFVQAFGTLGVIEHNVKLGVFKTFEPMELPVVSRSLKVIRSVTYTESAANRV